MQTLPARELTFEEVKREILRRVGKTNPFERTKKEDVEEVVERLKNLEPDHWGVEWGRIGARLCRSGTHGAHSRPAQRRGVGGGDPVAQAEADAKLRE